MAETNGCQLGDKPKRERLSLPLPFEEAVADILKVKPPPNDKPPKKRQKREVKPRGKKSQP